MTHAPLPCGKALILTRSLSAGGAERQAILNAQLLAQQGFEVDLACFYGSEVGYQEICGDGVRTLVLSPDSRSIRQVYRALAKRIEQEGYSVLYSFTGMPNVLTALCKLRNRKLKVLWGKRATRLKRGDYSLKYSIEVFAEKLMRRVPDVIISNSQASANEMVEDGFAADKIKVVYNGIDTATFRPATDHASVSQQAALRQSWFKETEHPFVIGCVARLDPMKGHATLLDAFHKAHSKCERLRLVIVGGDRRGLKDTLQEKARALGVQDKLAWVDHFDAVQTVYPAFDLVTLPSLYGEGFPNVLAEAMACGVPCVATDVGDAAVILGPDGLVVPPNAPDELAAAWLAMEAAPKPDPQHLWDSIDSRFSPAVLTRHMMRICQDVLGHSARQGAHNA